MSNSRYEIRWANGCWRIFDTERYTTVSVFGRKVDAKEGLKRYAK